MDKPTIPTLPVRQVTRKRIFAIRLTDRERAEIEALAKQLKLPDSSSFKATSFAEWLGWTLEQYELRYSIPQQREMIKVVKVTKPEEKPI